MEVVKNVFLFFALVISFVLLVLSFFGRRKTNVPIQFFIQHWIFSGVLGILGSEFSIIWIILNVALNAIVWFVDGYSSLWTQLTLVFSVLSTVGFFANIVQSISNRTLVWEFVQNFDLKPFPSPIPPPLFPNLLSKKLINLYPPSHYPEVTVKKNIKYGDLLEQILDVLFIEESNKNNQKRPIFVFVHGGAWSTFGNTKENTDLPMLYHLASKGWIVFTIDYRLSPKHKMPAHIDDVRLSIDWIRENAHKYQGDNSFVSICGNSAGGHLASLAALTCFATEKDGIRVPKINCCVSLYGVFDFVDRHQHWIIPFREFRDTLMPKSYKENPEIYHAISPIDFLHKEEEKHKVLGVHVPFLLVHGTCDEIVPLNESVLFAKHYQNVVKDHKLFFLELPTMSILTIELLHKDLVEFKLFLRSCGYDYENLRGYININHFIRFMEGCSFDLMDKHKKYRLIIALRGDDWFNKAKVVWQIPSLESVEKRFSQMREYEKEGLNADLSNIKLQ